MSTLQNIRDEIERLSDRRVELWHRLSEGRDPDVATELKELDVFPLPDEAPDFYVDYDETGPYVVETGESECAT